MTKAKTRQARDDEAASLWVYNADTREAFFNVMGRMYGPVDLSIPDLHTIGEALAMARKEGGLKAAREIKDQIDSTVTEIFKRY